MRVRGWRRGRADGGEQDDDDDELVSMGSRLDRWASFVRMYVYVNKYAESGRLALRCSALLYVFMFPDEREAHSLAERQASKALQATKGREERATDGRTDRRTNGRTDGSRAALQPPTPATLERTRTARAGLRLPPSLSTTTLCSISMLPWMEGWRDGWMGSNRDGLGGWMDGSLEFFAIVSQLSCGL